jgi:predicted MFS family arabinose efflux permease
MTSGSIRSRTAALTPVLVFVTLVAAVISSLGAPLVPLVSQHLHVSLSEAQWSLTAALLAGAISAPIMGRLGDGPYRRETIAAGLGIVFLGGIIAGLANDLPVLVVGRAMQGVGLGLAPLTMAAARDHLPREDAPAAIALLSVSAAAGVGAGYPISGLIAQHLGLHAAFLFGGLVSGVALLATLAVVPSNRDAPRARLDTVGALLVSVGLVALLLAIGQGNAWGWASARVLALFAAAVVVLAAWVVQQLRSSRPLVELRLLRRRAVLTGDVSALVLGIAMYMYLSLVTDFVQTSPRAGYGFGASVLVAGLCLVPFSILSLAASRSVPALSRRIGSRAIIPLGALAVAAAGAFFALVHSSLWQAFVTMGLVGIGLGYTFAAIPGLIVRAVPEDETGSAMGFYQVVRYVGFSLGSAVSAALLAAHTPPGQHLPTLAGYRNTLWIAAGICAAAAVVAWLLPRGGDSRTEAERAAQDRELARMMQEEGELGAAGLVGVERVEERP